MTSAFDNPWEEIIDSEGDETPRDVRNFNLIGKSPIWWLSQSICLHRAAELLMQKGANGQAGTSCCEPIALMLGAYAIENLLKMLVISNYCANQSDADTLTTTATFVSKTHDLRKLAADVGLKLYQSDLDILSRLTRYSVWGGRYPIPLQADGYELPALFDRAPGNDSLWTDYVRLFGKLHSMTTSKVPQLSGLR